jgi:hypothetical protein
MPENHNIPWKRLSLESTAIVAREILASLQIEFEVNRDEVASVLHLHEDALKYAAKLMSLTEDEILALSETEVERHVQYFAYPRTFDAVRGSVDALTTSGKLGILQDRELRESVTTFVNILEDAKEDREYMSRWAMIIWQEVAKDGGPYSKTPENRTMQECVDDSSESGCYIAKSMSFLPVATPQDLLRLRDNIVLMGYVNQNHENSARYAAEVKKAQNQIETILELIDRNL